MRNRMIIAVLIPFLGLLGWVLKLNSTAASGINVRLKVEGYDPRDLLSGHFVRYSVAYDYPELCNQSDDPNDVCACLTLLPQDNRYVAQWAGRCDMRPTDLCSRHYIRGRCEHGRFLAGIERFYIPEAYSPVLMTIPPNSSISVALDGSGGAVVTGLFVGGQPVDVYAREQLNTRSP